jgi:N-acetylneuraminic acid mutarotase
MKENKMSKSVGLLLVLILISASYLSRIKPACAAGDSWTTKTSMPTARAQLGVAVVNGKIYAIGGENNSAPGSPQ